MNAGGRITNDATCAISPVRGGVTHLRTTESALTHASRINSLTPAPAFAAKNLFLILACLCVIIGCAGVKPAAPVIEPTPAASIESLKAGGVVTVKRGISLTGRATVLVQRPASFRIEVSGPFGQTVALLISDGETFYIYSNGEEQAMRWDDPLMPYPVKAAELVSLMTGAAGLTAAGKVAQSTDMEGAAIEIEKTGSFEEGTVKKIEKTGPDGAPFEVVLSDYRIDSGISVPFNIKLIRGIEELTIKYSTVEINAAIPPDAFLIPAGK